MSDEKKPIEYGDDDELTLEQIAKVIGRSRELVRQLVHQLEIPHRRIGNVIVVKYKDTDPIRKRNTDYGYRYPKEE